MHPNKTRRIWTSHRVFLRVLVDRRELRPDHLERQHSGACIAVVFDLIQGGQGRTVEGQGRAVGGQGRAVGGQGRAVGGQGKAAGGQGKAVESQGKAVVGQGKAVEKVKESDLIQDAVEARGWRVRILRHDLVLCRKDSSP